MDAQQETTQKILRVAEEHFAVHGFFASSLRQITREAGVNVAAVHYHFGSKEAVFVAVLNQRIVPFIEKVLAGMSEAAHSRDVQPEDLVDAFIRACFDLIQEEERNAALLSKLVSRLMLDEYKIFRETLAEQNRDVAARLTATFTQILPDLPPQAVRWRMHLALSTLFNAFAGNDVLKALAPAKDEVNARDPMQVARYVKPFVLAGLKAELP